MISLLNNEKHVKLRTSEGETTSIIEETTTGDSTRASTGASTGEGITIMAATIVGHIRFKLSINLILQRFEYIPFPHSNFTYLYLKKAPRPDIMLFI